MAANQAPAYKVFVVEDRPVIESAIEKLRRPEGGRATLVDLSAQGATAPPQLPKGAGIVGRASELVRCDVS